MESNIQMEYLQNVLSAFKEEANVIYGSNITADPKQSKLPLDNGFVLSVDAIQAILEIKDEQVHHIQLSINLESKKVDLVKKKGPAFDINLFMSSFSDVSELEYHLIIDYSIDEESPGTKKLPNVTFVSRFTTNNVCEEFVSCAKALIILLESFGFAVRKSINVNEFD